MDRDKLVEVVSAAQNGDEAAFSELFSAFKDDVYYFALKTVKDTETANDITQETFMVVFTNLKDLREPAAFKAWMKQIAYTQCTKYFRKKKDIQVDEDEDGHTIFDDISEKRTEFIPDAALDQDDFRKTILKIVDELSEEQRSATMLFYYDEMSVKQIATIQGVSEGTVKSRLNYARKTLKKLIADYEEKHEVRLHSVGLVPLLFWLFSTTKESMSVSATTATAQAVSAAAGTAVAASETAVAAGTATATAGTAATTAGSVASGVSVAGATTATVAATTATGAGVASSVTALPLVAKVIAGVIAATITVGGVTIAANPDVLHGAEANSPPPLVQPSGEVPEEPSVQVESPVVNPTDALPEDTSLPAPGPSESAFVEIGPIEIIPVETDPVGTGPVETEPVEPSPTATTPLESEPTETEPIETDPVESEPVVTLHYVAADCTYVTAEGTVIPAGEAMPAESSHYDKYITNDYTYTYDVFYDGWTVAANDTTKTSYSEILGKVNGLQVTTLKYTFDNCTNMIHAPEIPYGVTNIAGAFGSCLSLVEAPTIPNTVINMDSAFASCENLKTAPIIPKHVITMDDTFYNCSSLEIAPELPNGITSLVGTFYGCSLTIPPEIPESVTNLSGTFGWCNKLTVAPVIPQTVQSIRYAFEGCTSLVNAPTIPASVNSMQGAFMNCSSLAGEIVINATFSDPQELDLDDCFWNCFAGTQNTIILSGTSPYLSELASTGENVTVSE